MLHLSIPLFASLNHADTISHKASRTMAQSDSTHALKDRMNMMTKDELYAHMAAVSNRFYCGAPDPVNNAADMTRFLDQVKRVCEYRPSRIILREKDLTPEDYTLLAERVLRVCEYEDIHLCLHNFIKASEELDYPYIHLPFPVFEDLAANYEDFEELTTATTVHSVEEAQKAQHLMADYIIAGNIYETTCKPGVPARGLDFLKSCVSSVTIPVYGIGGITLENLPEVMATGAIGGCMMSGFFKTQR